MRNIIWCISAILLVAYLVAIFICMDMTIKEPKCKGMEIKFPDETPNSFVTKEEISHELDDLPQRCLEMSLNEINTDSLERLLNNIDKIEKASCVVLNSGRIIVSITPMQPVARVFDGNDSYYINRVGKRISTDARYHLDVPVLTGHFDSIYKAIDMLPLLDYIHNDSLWASMISMVKLDKNHNIILIPMVKGHVINFGGFSNMENKFLRLNRFYDEVLDYKGWDCYDTIAVKWDGQIVATKRRKRVENKDVKYDPDIENEMPDIESMKVTNDSITETNNGQTNNRI